MSSKRRKTREIAMQMLFAWDSDGRADVIMADQIAVDATDDLDLRHAALTLAQAAWEQRQTIDEWVGRLAPQWPPRRQPGVDRALIRLAASELLTGKTPPKVAIDEAIELAKHFSTENSPAFVNGVLDALLREHQKLIAPRPLAAAVEASEPMGASPPVAVPAAGHPPVIERPPVAEADPAAPAEHEPSTPPAKPS